MIDICRRLDGLPLAIELAAARVPALGVQGVRERLDERLRMLTAGSRIALRRHQTLRAALDWSHGLLDAEEQAVFRRLGVFSGGCTIEAAQQVASDEQLDEWAVLDASGAWSTSRSSWPMATTGRATACWRAHARMRWKSSRRRGRPMRSRAAMRTTTPRMPSAAAMPSLPPAEPKTASSPRARPSSTTCVRR